MELVTKIKSWILKDRGISPTVAKNTAWLFAGQIFGRLTRVAIVIYAARILGPASWGAFSYVMGLVAFLTIFADVGISAIVTREASRDAEAGNKYFSTAFFIKILILFFGAAIFFVGSPFITKIEEAKLLFPVAALILVLDSLRNFGFSISRAKEKMNWEGGNEILTNGAITAFGFIALYLSPNSLSLITSYALAIGLGFLVIASQLKSYFKNLVTHFDRTLVKKILAMSWPFALFSSLGAIMINTDLIMLGWLRSAEEVGWYAAAQRPVMFLYIFPALFATSLFPTFSRLAEKNKDIFREILKTAVKIALFAALPITLFSVIFGNQIIQLLFGQEYLNSVLSFQILAVTFLIIFPSALINNAIFASNRQRDFIIFALVGSIGNIALNLILIPVWGIAGCAVSTLITQLIANSLMWIKIRSIAGFKLFG